MAEGRSNTKSDNKADRTKTILTKKSKKKTDKNILDLAFSLYEKIIGNNNKERLLKSLETLVIKCNQKSFISSEEQKMISNIIQIDDAKVSDAMIPRTDIVAIARTSTLQEIKDVIVNKEHTRIPIYGANLDEVIGFIHSKDLVKFLFIETKGFNINDLIRKIIYVPHSMRIMDLLRKMRSSRVHIAVVLDEYGGTDGLITIEDIMEEIVGEIEDEHDSPNDNIYNKIVKVNDTTFNVGGRVEIQEIEDLLEQKIVSDDSHDFETIGGFVLSEMKRIPQIGEILKPSSNLLFKILEADLRSIKLIEIIKTETNSENS